LHKYFKFEPTKSWPKTIILLLFSQLKNKIKKLNIIEKVFFQLHCLIAFFTLRMIDYCFYAIFLINNLKHTQTNKHTHTDLFYSYILKRMLKNIFRFKVDYYPIMVLFRFEKITKRSKYFCFILIISFK
jgi:hypothetical protein